MTTSGGYNPPDAGTCPYSPDMTRAAALALAGAAGLVRGCPVTIPGPVIGAGGAAGTSPTFLTLHPVSATEFGEAVSVNSTYGDGWAGLYDITADRLYSLTDNRNNRVEDIDPGNATVTTQFPWGSAAELRDNWINDMQLPNWSALIATDAVRDTRISGPANGVGTFDLGGSGAVAISNCEFLHSSASNFVRSGNCPLALNRTKSIGSTYTLDGGGGGLSMFDSVLNGAAITRAAAATGLVTVTTSNFQGGVTQNGPGAITLASVTGVGSTVSNTAPATRGLTVSSCILNGATVSQQKTINANIDFIQQTNISGGSTVTLSGAAGPAPTITTITASRIDQQATVNAVDSDPNFLQRSEVVGSTVNGVAGSRFLQSRISSGATVNAGAFQHQQLIVDGAFTKTLTAANVNRLVNKSFDDAL